MARRRARRRPPPRRRTPDRRPAVGGNERAETFVAVSDRPERVTIPATITVSDLAEQINMSGPELVGELFKQGISANINAPLDFETASLMLSDLNVEADLEESKAPEPQIAIDDIPEPEGEIGPRPPVVTVMGHVDHGKTTLLDYIRQSDVANREAGGITQSIGAYQVDVAGRSVTFIDTPGHAAFTKMRARGAGVTDIVVLVVAADDGVMPQTRDALGHAKAAPGVKIIVALNKIDLESSNPMRALSELATAGLQVEQMGGDITSVEVSALTGRGVDELLELILLTADLEPPQARITGPARATVLETRLDRSLGPVATAIISEGQLKVGDPFVLESNPGKVRVLVDPRGQRISCAGPSMAVEVIGIKETPIPGSVLYGVDSDKQARSIAAIRKGLSDRARARNSLASQMSLEQLAQQLTHGRVQQVDLVIKADTEGAAQATVQAVESLSTKSIRVNVVFHGVGAITENDINLATAASAIVLGFGVQPSANAAVLADQNGVQIRHYSIIYDLIDDVEKTLAGRFEPEIVEVIDGRLEVLGVFRTERALKIFGGRVTEGRLSTNLQVRHFREQELIQTGTIAAMQRFQDRVTEVNAGFECGLSANLRRVVREGDIIEAFHSEERLPG